MLPNRDLAIILRTTAYEERSRMVTALTQNHGLITALAKNSIQSRRFGGSLELFTASDWIFTQRPGTEFFHLTEAHVRKSFDQLPKNFENLAIASTFNEVILRVAPPGEKCPELFKLHSNALSTLNASPSSQSGFPLLNAYFGKILQCNGNQPQFHRCLACKIPLESIKNRLDPIFCRIIDASWVCSACYSTQAQLFPDHSITLSVLSIQDFQISLHLPIRQVAEQTRASLSEHIHLFQFLRALFVYHIPGFEKAPMKSLRFLRMAAISHDPLSHS